MNPRDWTIVCDFDGTIALEDVTDSLLARFARTGWTDLETRWRAGLIGSHACMAGQVALLDCSRTELDGYVARVAIDAAFPAFVQQARALDIGLEIVSDGLDHVCLSVLGRNELDFVTVTANRLVQAGPTRWRLEFPFAALGCSAGTCKCARAATHETTGRPYTLLIGDGNSDFCLAQRATMVFARGPLLRYCREAGIEHRVVPDFSVALVLLRQMFLPLEYVKDLPTQPKRPLA